MKRTRPEQGARDLTETGSFTVNVYADNARLLSEYCVDPDPKSVPSLEAVADSAQQKLNACQFSDVVLVVTEETAAGINQIQRKVSAGNPGVAKI